MTEGRSQVLKALSGLLVALFTATLSSTVVSTALPRMISDLGGSQAQYTWVVTATLLTATATTPIWGKLADLFSKKTLVQVAIGVFVAGSLASGFSQDAGQLIAARALQGAGVGGLQTLVQIAIAAMIPPRERGRYSGYLSSVTAVSTIGGPLLGGLVVDTSWLGWRWCFFIGVPVAIAALVLLQVTLNLPVVRRERVRVDYAGAALITAGVCLLLVWVSFVGDAFPWSSWPSLSMAGGAVLLLGAAVWVESRVPEPVVPLGIVRQRPTALAILGSLAAGTAMYGAAVFLSQYFQVSRGHTPTEAGLLTIPMMAGILVASTVVGRLVTRTGKLKPYLVAGSLSLTAGFAVLGFLDRETPLVVLSVAMALVGAGVGMTMQNFVLVVQNAVPLKDIGAASSTVSFFRSLGGTIGVAVLGAVLARDVAANQGDVPTAYGEATAQVFLISAAVAAVGVLAAVLLKPVVLRTSLDVVKEPERA
ncbi:MDR family MFS transporter [Actinosynnema mirum]|uniref:Major facilitator superfamily MFS_1 n=1 Tax=Actinosynnema mirum (strain ATCC 29888 / DSM 43827 / JCM 3225 / NBRC 14064 / NCIMB 13271 / NRRL B-12336 / IMRU 3971 / 101) TaxID=446462 RepID=C6WQK1_ACTMD|nr:MDR family MFS transporter [Actinosynnema mirum]ACU38691.1 major facilitator superfamily MFS_1 [Actinosynnema mirum DSM 43827]